YMLFKTIGSNRLRTLCPSCRLRRDCSLACIASSLFQERGDQPLAAFTVDEPVGGRGTRARQRDEARPSRRARAAWWRCPAWVGSITNTSGERREPMGRKSGRHSLDWRNLADEDAARKTAVEFVRDRVTSSS